MLRVGLCSCVWLRSFHALALSFVRVVFVVAFQLEHVRRCTYFIQWAEGWSSARVLSKQYNAVISWNFPVVLGIFSAKSSQMYHQNPSRLHGGKLVLNTIWWLAPVLVTLFQRYHTSKRALPKDCKKIFHVWFFLSMHFYAWLLKLFFLSSSRNVPFSRGQPASIHFRPQRLLCVVMQIHSFFSSAGLRTCSRHIAQVQVEQPN